VLIETHAFPDGEILPRIREATSTALIYRSLNRPNEKLVELLLAADALRRAGARRLVLAAPYLPYMRQDTVFRAGEPISQHVIARLLDQAFDRIVTVDPHLHRTRALSDIFNRASTTLLHSADALTLFLGKSALDPRTIIVGPDEESAPWVHAISEPLGLEDLVLMKLRRGDRDVEISALTAVDISGRPTLLVDDICSTGATLSAAVRTLRAAGSPSVSVFVTHALCSDDTLDQLHRAGAGRLISSDACVHSTNAVHLASTLAAALRNEIAP
jgi:ribose-phosphate pyrophosphokinase